MSKRDYRTDMFKEVRSGADAFSRYLAAQKIVQKDATTAFSNWPKIKIDIDLDFYVLIPHVISTIDEMLDVGCFIDRKSRSIVRRRLFAALSKKVGVPAAEISRSLAVVDERTLPVLKKLALCLELSPSLPADELNLPDPEVEPHRPKFRESNVVALPKR